MHSSQTSSLVDWHGLAGHFLFTELLMPALISAAETSPDKHARVVTTSSFGAYFEPIRWDTFTDGPARLKLSKETLYYQSKLVSHAGHGEAHFVGVGD